MTPKNLAHCLARQDEMAKTENQSIRVGFQIMFWIFNPQFAKRFRLGTVTEIGIIKIGGKTRKFYATAEYPQLPILEQQVEKIVNKVSVSPMRVGAR